MVDPLQIELDHDMTVGKGGLSLSPKVIVIDSLHIALSSCYLPPNWLSVMSMSEANWCEGMPYMHFYLALALVLIEGQVKRNSRPPGWFQSH